MLTFIFILSINVFLTSNTLDKRFHRAIRNEEIDGSIDSTKRNLNRTSTFKMDVTISLQESTKSMISEQQDSQMLNNECFLMRNLMNKRSKNKNIDKLCDLLITIKTTKTNHRSRIKLIIDTWFKLISSKTYLVTDAKDDYFSRATNLKADNLVVTNCEQSHERHALVCKIAAEFKIYEKNPTKWFCHADDDTYLNINRLITILSQYDPNEDWYIGRKSTDTKVNVPWKNVRAKFDFATGGAGFCFSYGLAMKLAPLMKLEKLIQLSDDLGLPDDILLGFLIEVVIGTKLTNNPYFHSHLESLQFYNTLNIKDQVSLSYNLKKNNVVDIESKKNDPTKLKAIHNFLYPNR